MTPTVALQLGGFLVLIGLVLGALGLGAPWAGAAILPGLAALLASTRGAAEPRPVPIPVRARRRPSAR